jgi:hypothetical protein
MSAEVVVAIGSEGKVESLDLPGGLGGRSEGRPEVLLAKAPVRY